MRQTQEAEERQGHSLMLDAEALYQQLRATVASHFLPEAHLVGITSGGAWLVERLQSDMGLAAHVCGVISSTLHRDDFASRGLAGQGSTRLAFDIEGADIVLVDDVLYTGRTLRAVINELFDYGRPARVRLAVLVDRGGRQLPIAADYAAARITLPPEQSLSLSRDADGRLGFDVRTPRSARGASHPEGEGTKP